ncbi:intrinsic membrane protein PufX [Palleronia aestuarii]|uniref:Intrinsic membrane protein PufX n=1 Tax=Palleronia aestuarii TaxID=568105 RepID=A0A2W7MV46_9RHOB|nr:RC-LH1 core complex protein PufX [Palleronia aestuarii]PZX11413.1 intrinsic membrane protein PufX [Palleronia aestuarii]
MADQVKWYEQAEPSSAKKALALWGFSQMSLGAFYAAIVFFGILIFFAVLGFIRGILPEDPYAAIDLTIRVSGIG